MSMNLRDVKIEVQDGIDAGNAVIVESAPGVGKSELLDQIRKENSARDGEEWGMAKLFLATQTPTDLLGYVFKGQLTWEGKTIPISEPTLPLWMVTEDGKPTWAYKRGFLVLDEFGQGEGDTKRASAELLLNKQLGPHKLGGENRAGWGVVALSNTMDDRSGVTKSFDFINNRVKKITAHAELQVWIDDYAVPNHLAPLIIAFAIEHPNLVFESKVPEKQRQWCTPRSLVKAAKELEVKARRNGGEIPEDARTQQGIAGLIGEGEAAQLFAFVKLDRQMPKYEKIVADPKGTRVPDKPDALMLIAYKLAHRVSDKDIAPVATYVQRMPKEFAVTFLKAACNRVPALVTSPTVSKWTLENASLMAAIAK